MAYTKEISWLNPADRRRPDLADVHPMDLGLSPREIFYMNLRCELERLRHMRYADYYEAYDCFGNSGYYDDLYETDYHPAEAMQMRD